MEKLTNFDAKYLASILKKGDLIKFDYGYPEDPVKFVDVVACPNMGGESANYPCAWCLQGYSIKYLDENFPSGSDWRCLSNKLRSITLVGKEVTINKIMEV